MKPTLVAMVALVMMCSAGICTSTPIDPLVREDASLADFQWSLDAGFAVTGIEESQLILPGELYEYSCLRMKTWVSVAAECKIGAEHSFAVSFRSTRNSLIEEQRLGGEVTELETYTDSESLSCTYEARLAPSNTLDPRLELRMEFPAAIGATLSASFIRDPLVLIGGIEALYESAEPQSWLGIETSVGFVANDKMCVAASGAIWVPRSTAAAPLSTLSLTVRGSDVIHGRTSASATFTLLVGGSTPWFGMTLLLEGA